MNTLPSRGHHWIQVGIAAALSILLVVAGVLLGDAFDLPLVNSWAVLHGAFLLLVPAYYWVLIRVVRRLLPGTRGA